MPEHRQVLLHSNGPALWPEHKSLDDVLLLKETTPTPIWQATYQGQPTGPGGRVFNRAWWRGKNRYDPSRTLDRLDIMARYISWDTANVDAVDAAFTSASIADLMRDYTLRMRWQWRGRVEFNELPGVIQQQTAEWDYDGLLREVIIEDKASGTSALQTLRAATDWRYSGYIRSFLPTTDKLTRAHQAAVWCRNDCVLLPIPDSNSPWLPDFEDELYSAPASAFMDQVDAFSQLVLWLEAWISTGWHSRRAA